MSQLSALCDRHRLYVTVIISIRRLLTLYDSYQLCATVIFTIKQVSALCDSYVSCAIVISSMRQLSVLCDRYRIYPTNISPVSYSTVISSYKKIIFNVLLVHHRSVLLKTFLNYQEIKKLIVATYMLRARLFL